MYILRAVPVLPLLFVGCAFAGQSFTSLKAAVVLLGVALLGGRNTKNCFDLNFLVLLTLTTVYTAISLISSNIKSPINPSLAFFPAALYAGGKLLGYRCQSTSALINTSTVIGLLLALFSAHAVLLDIREYGFLGGIRTIEVEALGVTLSATVLAGTLVMLTSSAGIAFAADRSFGIVPRLAIAGLAAVAIFVSLRLGSRTQTAIAGISILLALLLSSRKSLTVTAALSAVAVTIGLLLSKILFEGSPLLSYYEDRADSAEFGAGSFGGRSQQWAASLPLLLSNPLGWDIHAIGYSHNLWLDAARNGGWPSFALAILAGFRFVIGAARVCRRQRDDVLLTTHVVCVSAGFMALFSVEPIFDGFMYPFAAFCCFWGAFVAFSSRSKFPSKPSRQQARSALPGAIS